ncbi:hypothetical protein GCM10009422_18980 [Brevundimonas kwangchunensis]|uniref:Uncharacterized protein n=1 Tax=Brevundimonas kwangchunensis TaxID=322163 RepID=A0ABN1GY05_9CAUL
MGRMSVTERAYELARTGRYHTLMGLRRALETEYTISEVSAALDGRAIRKSLKTAWEAAGD